MANTITVTGSASLTFATDLELDIYAGSPEDSTTWLDGNAGGSYPGSLTGFVASNTDGNAVKGMKLLVGRLTGTLANGNTLTVSGGATTIIAAVVGGGTSTNGGTSVTFSGAVATFATTGTPTVGQSVLMIVA